MLSSKLLYEKLSDEELFNRVRQEDSQAFEVLYCRYWSILMDTAYRRIRSREKAEDIIQEIFISLYQNKQRVQFTVSVQAYLMQALKYKLLNEMRAQAVRVRYQQNFFLNSQCKIDFAGNIEAKELQHTIHKSISSLPDKCRQVFCLSRWELQSNKHISNHLAISVSTVEKHISKALHLIRKDLHEFNRSGKALSESD